MGMHASEDIDDMGSQLLQNHLGTWVTLEDKLELFTDASGRILQPCNPNSTVNKGTYTPRKAWERFNN